MVLSAKKGREERKAPPQSPVLEESNSLLSKRRPRNRIRLAFRSTRTSVQVRSSSTNRTDAPELQVKHVICRTELRTRICRIRQTTTIEEEPAPSPERPYDHAGRTARLQPAATHSKQDIGRQDGDGIFVALQERMLTIGGGLRPLRERISPRRAAAIRAHLPSLTCHCAHPKISAAHA